MTNGNEQIIKEHTWTALHCWCHWYYPYILEWTLIIQLYNRCPIPRLYQLLRSVVFPFLTFSSGRFDMLIKWRERNMIWKPNETIASKFRNMYSTSIDYGCYWKHVKINTTTFFEKNIFMGNEEIVLNCTTYIWLYKQNLWRMSRFFG